VSNRERESRYSSPSDRGGINSSYGAVRTNRDIAPQYCLHGAAFARSRDGTHDYSLSDVRHNPAMVRARTSRLAPNRSRGGGCGDLKSTCARGMQII